MNDGLSNRVTSGSNDRQKGGRVKEELKLWPSIQD